MKKKIWISVAVVVVLLVVYVGYRFATTRGHSPVAIAAFSEQGLDIKVDYCRPYKKGRLIFGNESEKALVPFGKYWRLGANDATEISFNKNVMFGGKPVPAGRYRMYAVPGKDSWQVSLNSELGKFGYMEPAYKLDVAKADASLSEIPETEQFTISFSPQDGGASLNFEWDKTKASVPVALAP